MFRDQKKELDRLEKALLAQESEELPEEDTPAAQIPEDAVYNNDYTDVDLEEFEEDVYEPPKKRPLWPLALAFALLTAVFCGLIWWILKNGGYLG